VLMAFDLLELDRFDLRGVSLLERKRALGERFQSAGAVGTRVRWVDHVMGRGSSVEEHACEIGARTIVSKRTDAKAGAPFQLVRCKNGEQPLDIELPEPALETLKQTRFTNPDRVLYPAQGITKLELARYYAAVADYMMPHLSGRILTMYRCPEGQGGTCFYQKHVRPGMPKSLRRVPVVESDEEGIYVVADDLAGLLGLVQIGVLEIHGWMSTDAHLEQPDRMIFDLDPDPSLPWSEVTRTARALRERMRTHHLESFVSTTGKKGLHVVVPLVPRADYEAVKDFARTVAQEMAIEEPKRYVAVQTKSKRAGKIYLDFLRNGRGSSAIVPFSTRAAPGAPVATPIRWDELDRLVGADAFNLRTLPARLAKTGDAWEGFFELEQALPE
jgi:bifunctional non-homologous end joining protein LigD